MARSTWKAPFVDFHDLLKILVEPNTNKETGKIPKGIQSFLPEEEVSPHWNLIAGQKRLRHMFSRRSVILPQFLSAKNNFSSFQVHNGKKFVNILPVGQTVSNDSATRPSPMIGKKFGELAPTRHYVQRVLLKKKRVDATARVKKK